MKMSPFSPYIGDLDSMGTPAWERESMLDGMTPGLSIAKSDPQRVIFKDEPELTRNDSTSTASKGKEIATPFGCTDAAPVAVTGSGPKRNDCVPTPKSCLKRKADFSLHHIDSFSVKFGSPMLP